MISPSKRRPRGRPPHPDVLTPAEWRVLDEVRRGHTNAEIATRLEVSVNTVRTQVSSMLGKLGVADRRSLARWQGEPATRSTFRGALFALPWRATTRIGGIVALSAAAVLVLSTALSGPARDDQVSVVPTPAATPTEGTGKPAATPDGAGSGALSPLFFEYTVQAGDTMSSIAVRFGISAPYLGWSNPQIPADEERPLPGEVLRVPALDGILHDVQAGETPATLGARYSVNPTAIIAISANHVNGPDDVFRPGAVVLVPGGKRAQDGDAR